ncbi:MAG: aminotransferase class V-fold PLP-dependent enzyme [Bdellovibrionaceae bacterium]|nr:aminotransferase class V-fold PLP-dependent enzyme [Pseudobdellovibrionaceae bacterium]
MHINEFKKQFNQNSPYIHLNTSGMGPIPEANRQKAIEWLNRFYTEGAFCSNTGWAETDRVRAELAQFVGAQTEEIAFFQTTASALSQVALSVPLKQDDQILTWAQEYPSNFYPWRIAAERSGAEIIQIESENFETPIDRILEKVNKRTKVITVSWVQFQTGAVTDLKALSSALKDRGIWLVADVIQGLGVRPFDFADSGFDVVCCGSHKWLCSSFGAAFMAIKKEKLDLLQPIEFGAMTYGDPDTIKSFTIPTKKSGAKFEPGSKAMIEIIAMGETIKILQAVGVQNIYNEAERLASKLRDGLIEMDLKICRPDSGVIINVAGRKNETDPAETNKKISSALKAENISYALRGPGVRLSVHAFNTDEEIERTLAVIKRAL